LGKLIELFKAVEFYCRVSKHPVQVADFSTMEVASTSSHCKDVLNSNITGFRLWFFA